MYRPPPPPPPPPLHAVARRRAVVAMTLDAFLAFFIWSSSGGSILRPTATESRISCYRLPIMLFLEQEDALSILGPLVGRLP
jgi:hypothetical protein